ncbi:MULTISPECIES: hypothetical protein [unclassified Pseudomonas]|uniref:hypothetical protein n=1 Tax=unclassified Pseudomonas TaxID=196821 RepID=UPI00244C5649|nr:MULTISPECIES: hypothetical protein [unclassified Pseudomonas]MDH0301688.1 hypothetical protein [Pseudomonas sp. GD04091]MDH1984907.1 hypothetical protein [Pseudomonas sp. GD03689]
MKTTRTCLALIVCVFAAAYVAALTRPLPVPLAYYCQVNHAPCWAPVSYGLRLMP